MSGTEVEWGLSLSLCALCYHPRGLTLPGLIFNILLWLHLSEPEIGPLYGIAVTLTFTKQQRGLRVACGNSAVPWEGPVVPVGISGGWVGDWQPKCSWVGPAHGLPWWLSGKFTCNARDSRDESSIPGSGRSSGGECGNPLQYSCLKYPVDRGTWWATVQRVAKSLTQLSN